MREALVKVCPSLAGDLTVESPAVSQVTVPRPPALCQGCGHRDVYSALNEVLRGYENPKVFGDIGCYTLGWLSPFNALDSCVDMGASITMAKGAADARTASVGGHNRRLHVHAFGHDRTA